VRDESAPRYFAMTRVSSKRQAEEGLSFPEQDAKLRADREENFPEHVYTPVALPGISGGARSDRHRSELLARIGAGDVLAAVKLDRMGRSTLSVLQLVLGAHERGAKVRMLRDDIDTSTAVGRYMLTSLAAVAELEREFNSERVRETVQRRKREVPVWAGGRRPYCFADSTRRELVASEVRVWNAEIVPRFLTGVSEMQLCRELNALGIPAASGGQWRPSALTKQLQAPYMFGLRRLEDGSLVETGLPAPSDPEAFKKATTIFEARPPMAERRGRESGVPAIAAAKTLPPICACCGSVMRIRARGKRSDGQQRGSYVCDRKVNLGPGSCPMPNVPVAAVTGALLRVFADDLVDERETRRLMQRAAEQVTTDTRKALRASEREEMKLRVFVDRLREQFRSGEVSPRVFESELERAEADSAAVKSETERLRLRVERIEGEGALYEAEQQLLDRLAAIRELAKEAHPSDPQALRAAAVAIAAVIESIEIVDTRLDWALTRRLPVGSEYEVEAEMEVPVRLIATGVEGIFLNLVPRVETAVVRETPSFAWLEPGSVALPATIAASSR
jgi:site-specific DNA recombinase